MMSNNNIIEYVNWRGDISFNEHPLNCVDALIFSQLIHISYEYFLPNPHENSFTIQNIYKTLKCSDFYSRFIKTKSEKQQDAFLLLELCSSSKRFSNVIFCDYEQIFEKENECQFAAGTYILDDKAQTKIIAYRGTDSSIIGWKEDFNLVYLDPIPSQKYATQYLDSFFKKHKGNIYLSGHSKGANNAIYASMNVAKKVQKRIVTIFNFDGPGLKKDQIESEQFNIIKNKINSYYPSFCLVGQLFYKKKQYQIISSNAKSFSQHDPFTWKINKETFEHELCFAKESVILIDILNSVLSKFTIKEQQKIIDSFFSVFLSAGLTTFEDYEDNKFKYAAKMISAYASLEPSCRMQIIQLITQFLPVCKERLPILNFFK